MNMKCRVIIDRGQGRPEHFDGSVIEETTSHVKVVHQSNPDVGEWLPRISRATRVSVYGKK